MRNFLKCTLKLILWRQEFPRLHLIQKGAQVQALSADHSVATSERGDAKPASDSEQVKPNIVLTYDKSREATATAESQAVISMYKSESTLYTSELAGNRHAIEKSEFSS